MKIVREHINEKFTEEGDPLKDMGITGNSVNFNKQASKILKKYPLYNKNNDYDNQHFKNALGEWVEYMKSISDKTMYGKFTSESFTGEKYLKIKYHKLASFHFGYPDFVVFIYKNHNDKLYTIKNEYYVILNEQI